MSTRVAGNWFYRKKIDDGVTYLTEPHVTEFLRCNIWHIAGRDRDILVDTGLGIQSLQEAAEDLFGRDLLAVATHTHYDHIGGMHEFDHCAVHRKEAGGLQCPEPASLLKEDIPPDELEKIESAGYRLENGELIAAHPCEDYSVKGFHIKPSTPTWLLDDGDIIDTGDRHFKVLHLPGHSPGSIGLWEEKTRTLFSGDAVYDGPLLHNLPGSDLEHYLITMERLRKLDVRIVHGGHGVSFGQDRLHALIDDFVGRHGG